MKFWEKIKKGELIKNYQYYTLMLPAIALFFAFTYMAFPGIILAFKKYDASSTSILGGEWVGLSNFKAFIENPYFYRLLRNTFALNITNLFFSTIFTVFFALILNELNSGKLRKIFQNILFLPTFFSVIIVAKLLTLILDSRFGLLNIFFNNLGIDSVNFYQTSKPWIAILVITNIWRGVGSGLIVYLAVMMGFDNEMYEAAYLDGAGRFKQLINLTLPLLIPTLVLLTLMNIGKIFYGDFGMIYAVAGTNAVLLERLDIIETYVFRMVTGGVPDYGLAGAIGVFQTIIGFIMIFGSNCLVKLYNKDYALF